MEESKVDINAVIPHAQQTFMFMADYLQWMPVPRFKSVQLGEAYYYSKAIGNVFGIVDLSGKDDNNHILTAYFYMEGNAKKAATRLPQ